MPSLDQAGRTFATFPKTPEEKLATSSTKFSGENNRLTSNRKTIGSGTYEIRTKESGDEYRIFYVAKFGGTIYVLHAFQKKSRETPDRHLNIGRRQYKIAKEHAGA